MSDASRSSRRAALGAMSSALLAVLSGCRAGDPISPRPVRPRRPEAPVTWRNPYGERFAVVIDPGHGGSDAGTRAANGLLEKDLTLDVARRLRTRLLAAGDIDVHLTRDRDVWMPREARVVAVRGVGADLLLSLHFNGLPERDITLVETYYAHASNIVDSRERRRQEALRTGTAPAIEPADVSFTRGSERFATLAQRHVFAAVDDGHPRAVDAGVKRDTLFVLTRGATSGALIELTCLSNDFEADRLRGEPYRERLAAALARAVADYRELSNVVAPVEVDM